MGPSKVLLPDSPLASLPRWFQREASRAVLRAEPGCSVCAGHLLFCLRIAPCPSFWQKHSSSEPLTSNLSDYCRSHGQKLAPGPGVASKRFGPTPTLATATSAGISIKMLARVRGYSLLGGHRNLGLLVGLLPPLGGKPRQDTEKDQSLEL